MRICKEFDAEHAVRLFADRHCKKHNTVHAAPLNLGKVFVKVPHIFVWGAFGTHNILDHDDLPKHKNSEFVSQIYVVIAHAFSGG